MNYPREITKLLGSKSGQLDSIGLSNSSVVLFDDCVLKISPDPAQASATAEMMRWLQGKVPIPELICHAVEDGISFLLMSRFDGTMACDDRYLSRPQILLPALVEGMHLLWKTDIDGCPRIQTLEDMLRQARYQVENGLVDMDLVDPDTFGPGGFRDPEALLFWLNENKPESVLCLTHGDHCLPNVFLRNDRFAGYIDLDDFGVGEKWRDIALCYRSLRDNLMGRYGGKVYQDTDPNNLFALLGIQPDPEQLRWHLLLDELF